MKKSATKGMLLLLFAFILGAGVSGDTVWENQNIGDFQLKQPGVYRIKGTVTGNINLELAAAGDVIIEGVNGTNPVLQGIPRPGEKRHVSHIKGSINGNNTLLIRNLTVKGDGHNAIEAEGIGYKELRNVHVINYARTEGGKQYDDVGSVNLGQNSLIRDCYLETGDDAAKLTEPNSRCLNTRVRLTKNGAAFQLGWDDRFGGADHIADNVEVRGQLAPNLYDAGALRSNDDGNPGRCIIGGIIQNNGNNIQLTNLNIDVTDYKHLIKLVAQDGATQDPVLKDVLIQGTVTGSSVFNHVENGYTFYAVALTAQNGAKIRNMVVDLGKKVADPQFHWIKGDVNVKFIFDTDKMVEYVNGQMVRNDHDGNNNSTPAPTPRLTPTPQASGLGDVNNDGVINIIDALMTAQYSVGLNPPGFLPARGDTNCDGAINIVDALRIAQHNVGSIKITECT